MPESPATSSLPATDEVPTPVPPAATTDEFSERVGKRARRLARGPRNTLAKTKEGVNAPILAELDAALDRETHGQTEILTGPEFAEGVAAMLGKRRPDFVSLR